jgi:hypothetical protein
MTAIAASHATLSCRRSENVDYCVVVVAAVVAVAEASSVGMIEGLSTMTVLVEVAVRPSVSVAT